MVYRPAQVNRCINKLSDCDTEAMAVRELDSPARSLSLISAISDARPFDKTPLRRHSLLLLPLIFASYSHDTLSPILPRMLSSTLRHLRDPDSSVRLACVDAATNLLNGQAGTRIICSIKSKKKGIEHPALIDIE